MPAGGHSLPSSTLTARLLWKKAQKNLRKKNTSEIIKRIIPHRSPSSTIDVWYPIKDLSRLTSRHHWNAIIIKKFTLNTNKLGSLKWNHFNSPEVNPNPLNEASRGQGDSSTKWNGCRSKLDIIKDFIV
jgi:hypothetical protein